MAPSVPTFTPTTWSLSLHLNGVVMPCRARSSVAYPLYGVMPSSMRPMRILSFASLSSLWKASASGALMWASWRLVMPQLRYICSRTGQLSTRRPISSSPLGAGIMLRTISMAAFSSSLPVGIPLSSFSRLPPAGCSVSFDIPAISSARLLATELCPPALPR